MKLVHSLMFLLSFLGLSACSDSEADSANTTASAQGVCSLKNNESGNGEVGDIGDVLYKNLKLKGKVECRTADASRVCD